jgi:hypothetical protein
VNLSGTFLAYLLTYWVGNSITILVVANVSRVVLPVIHHNLFGVVKMAELVVQTLAKIEHQVLYGVRSYDERFWKVFGANGVLLFIISKKTFSCVNCRIMLYYYYYYYYYYYS